MRTGFMAFIADTSFFFSSGQTAEGGLRFPTPDYSQELHSDCNPKPRRGQSAREREIFPSGVSSGIMISIIPALIPIFGVFSFPEKIHPGLLYL